MRAEMEKKKSKARKGDAIADGAQDGALAKLQALGDEFLASFGPGFQSGPVQTKAGKKSKKENKSAASASAENLTMNTKSSADPAIEDEMEQLLKGIKRRTPTESTDAPSHKKRKRAEPQVFVFDGSRASSSLPLPPAAPNRKEFMSSKTTRITGRTDSTSTVPTSSRSKGETKGEVGNADGGGEEDEKENASNDRLLSRLLSTTLFAPGSNFAVSGGLTGHDSKKRDLSSTSTVARIMELTTPESKRSGGTAVGRGWGEMAFKSKQMGKTPSSMQAGLTRARKEKHAKEIQREKELGIYRPELKHGEVGAKGADAAKKRRRERGIGMGVGTFKNGALHISKHDAAKIQSKGKGRSRK